MHVYINRVGVYAFNKPSFWVRHFVLSEFGLIASKLLSWLSGAVATLCFVAIVFVCVTATLSQKNALMLMLCILMLVNLGFCCWESRGYTFLKTLRKEIIEGKYRSDFVTEDDYSYVLVYKTLQYRTHLTSEQLDELFAKKNLMAADTMMAATSNKHPEQIEAYYKAKREIITTVQAGFGIASPDDFQAVAELLHDQRMAADREQHSMAKQLVIKLEADMESMQALARRTGLHIV